MVKVTGVYHTSIPCDDLDRAERFYTEVLGIEKKGRTGEGGSRLSRLQCGDDTVVLFQRPTPLNRDSRREDGIYHQAFLIDINDFDEAVETLKRLGSFVEIIERGGGPGLYYRDPEGNYGELRAFRRE